MAIWFDCGNKALIIFLFTLIFNAFKTFYMSRSLIAFFLLFTFYFSFSQKKPLDHTVYDNWQSIGERMISNDGKWVVYTINVQEGDNQLVIQSSDTIENKRIFPRGYNAVITEDNRFAVFKIKPFFKDTRDARIKKKRPD